MLVVGDEQRAERHPAPEVTSAEARSEAERVRTSQGGLLSRKQAMACGMTRVEIARLLRRGEWVAVHEGVYIGHNGPRSWHERAWAAVLWAEPAALCLDSALRAAEGPGRRGRDDDLVHVAIDLRRRVVAPDGVVVHRTQGFDERVQWNCSPPRVRHADAVLDVAAAAPDDLAAIATLADACGSWRTTALKLSEALAKRRRVARRAWLVGILDDVAQGTCSVLEHGYLVHVERAHGLPEASRQKPRPTAGGGTLQDVSYTAHEVVVELDGRIGHTSTSDRDDDLDRDLENAVEHHELTLRIGYRQVFDDSCRTARRVASVLRRRGWAGVATSCRQCGDPDEPT
jgi:hypothetical protein